MSDDRGRDFGEAEISAFLRGEAEAELTEAISRKMAENPDFQADIALQKGLKPALAAMSEGNPPGALGWRRLEAALAEEIPAPPAEKAVVGGYWRVAAVILGAVVLLQGAFAVAPRFQAEEARFHTATRLETQAELSHELAIAFRPDTPIEAVTALLLAVDGDFVSGPNPAGLFRVGFATEEALSAALQALEQNALVSLLARP